MNREDYLEEIVSLAKTKKNLLIQWPTGVGKSRCALEVIREYEMSPYDTGVVFPKYLIVVPKLVLIDNWKEEIRKWLGEDKISFFSFTTYVSFYKAMSTYWNCIIFDEGHHFTERCAEAFVPEQTDRILVLSATVKKEARLRLFETIPSLWYHKVSTRKVIEDNILPDPTVFLVPLHLSQLKGSYIFTKNPKETKAFKVSYMGRWPYMKRKERIDIVCTAEQCHLLHCESVKYWEGQFKRFQQPWAKSKWLHFAGERLRWLSEIKTPLIKDILEYLDDYRTLTFCSSIEQTKQLGEHNIHSENKEQGMMALNDFNARKINHITACAMLNEGVNLTECQVGIFAGLTASEIAQVQKLGRILRHPKPLIVVPYFVGTRDEEIVNKMKKDYNPELTRMVEPAKIKEEIKNYTKK